MMSFNKKIKKKKQFFFTKETFTWNNKNFIVGSKQDLRPYVVVHYFLNLCSYD